MTVELRTEIFVSMAHELACHVMAIAGREQNLEIGEKWLNRARAAMSPELRKALSGYELGAHAHGPFYGLGLMAYGHRWVSVDDMVRGLESMPERDLILETAGLGDTPGAREQLDDLVMRTAAGDKSAARELAKRGQALGHHGAAQLAKWLPRAAPRLRESLIEVTKLWDRDLFAREEDKLAPILERDARAKGELARRLSPAQLLEEATNGFIWVDQLGLDTIALVPTWIMRPWTVDGLCGSAAVISYPVADESLGTNGDAVTARAVKLARVLSDESRVRAIQLMAVEPLSLMELAAKLDLNKSTIHHHLAELRAAGLLKVPMGTKRYSLRPEALYRFGALLGDLAKPAHVKPRKEKK
ncbi:MAG TPA: ArsR family transcriptional regulator [Candidatus Acidoferrum sp.]|jgi:DNA-binding transcriptional ArsR family regulator|nr:ArsR family transcriptional regulator [Candidatus Acidoferrum sp.]